MDSDQSETVSRAENCLLTRANMKYLSRWAFGGLVGTAVTLIGAGIVLEFIIDGIAFRAAQRGGDGNPGASLMIVMAIAATIFGYPIVGAIIGVVMGMRKLKHDLPKGDINENNYGLLTGAVVGIAFYVLIFIIGIIISIINTMKST